MPSTSWLVFQSSEPPPLSAAAAKQAPQRPAAAGGARGVGTRRLRSRFRARSRARAECNVVRLHLEHARSGYCITNKLSSTGISPAGAVISVLPCLPLKINLAAMIKPHAKVPLQCHEEQVNGGQRHAACATVTWQARAKAHQLVDVLGRKVADSRPPRPRRPAGAEGRGGPLPQAAAAAVRALRGVRVSCGRLLSTQSATPSQRPAVTQLPAYAPFHASVTLQSADFGSLSGEDGSSSPGRLSRLRIFSSHSGRHMRHGTAALDLLLIHTCGSMSEMARSGCHPSGRSDCEAPRGPPRAAPLPVAAGDSSAADRRTFCTSGLHHQCAVKSFAGAGIPARIAKQLEVSKPVSDGDSPCGCGGFSQQQARASALETSRSSSNACSGLGLRLG